jgi:hypothetical protein
VNWAGCADTFAGVPVGVFGISSPSPLSCSGPTTDRESERNELQRRFCLSWLAPGGVLHPLVDLDVESANDASSRVRGLGDMTFGP